MAFFFVDSISRVSPEASLTAYHKGQIRLLGELTMAYHGRVAQLGAMSSLDRGTNPQASARPGIFSGFSAESMQWNQIQPVDVASEPQSPLQRGDPASAIISNHNDMEYG